jgi:pyruvate,water dikinase
MRAKSLRTASGSTPVAGSAAPSVPDLRHPAAQRPALAGAKASRLARAAEVGLPVVPGFVVTTRAAGLAAAADDAVRAWRALSDDGRLPVVVRSSSSAEDGERSSMAGRFTSVLNVRDEEGFRAALAEVAASGETIDLDAPGGRRPMAILVQRQLEPRWSGVAFGFDPVSGRRDRRVIAAVEGLPDALVGGSTFGRQVVLSRHGRVVESTGAGPALPRSVRHAVLGLAERAERLFRSPQDIEWAVDDDGRAYLLQSRPITAATLPAAGPMLGPGPVAETLPDPLWPLEESLWVDPLRAAVRRTLAITGTASRRRLAASPVIVAVHGRVAADLALVGVSRTARRGLAKLDPRPPLRRLGAAWRVGRLRAALPALAEDVVSDVDEALDAVPALSTLDDEALLSLLRRSAQALVAVHGHEMLAALLTVRDRGSTAAGAALSAVAAGRREGYSDAEIVRTHPVVLALSAPAIGSAPALGPTPDGDGAAAAADVGRPLSIREGLRLRARWLQELEARAVRELVRRGSVPDPGPDARLLTQVELEDLVRTGATPLDWRDRRPPRPTPPLPAAFRLTADGTVVATRARGSELAGQGAGGGRGIGPVDVGPTPATGSVLVVRTLDPALASQLPHLAGLVAETGSVLSHLAILAREYGVPTVVGVERAMERFAPGDMVIVDGLTGEVSVAPPADEAGAR